MKKRWNNRYSKKKKWDDRDRPQDRRLFAVEVEGPDGWGRLAIEPLRRADAERYAADVWLSFQKKPGVRIVPVREEPRTWDHQNSQVTN